MSGRKTALAQFFRSILASGAAVMLCGCNGVQSALAPDGAEAERVWLLFWILTVGGSVILVAVLVLTAIAIVRRPAWIGGRAFIVGGGLVLPGITLSALLTYGLTQMHVAALPSGHGPPLQLSIGGEQWWWRVIYATADGRNVESANEIRIPVGRPVRIELTSADVIHSFWIPKLAGKLDIKPGRKTVLHLTANMPGVNRGQCAEYCGGAHAFMALYAIALLPEEFESWFAKEQEEARPASDPESTAGQLLFLSHGCGGCHAIRGTSAIGTIGPDLTHFGSRMSLGAATLPNDQAEIARWIADNQHIKPENRMPPFGIFSRSELASLSKFLSSLK
jgi:cytochrome c oxidase subunit 2